MRKKVVAKLNTKNELLEVAFIPEGLDLEAVNSLYKEDLSKDNRDQTESIIFRLAKEIAIGLGKMEESEDCSLLKYRVESL